MPLDDKPDSEVVALAASIANEVVPEVVEKAGEVVAPGEPPKVASEEKVEKPASKEKPKKEAKREPDQEVVEEGGEVEPEEGVEPKEADEFFKDINLDKPDEAVKALLKHPVLGPQLQSWSDGGVRPQVEQEVERRLETERPSIAASERRTAQEKQEDEHFASLSKEELTEELNEDPKAAAAYGRYQQRLQAPKGSLSPTAVTRSSEVYAVAHQLRLNNQLVEGSELPPETKEKLKAENFADQGREGLLIWGQEIFKALVEHEAGKLAQGLHESTWEAEKQVRLADLDGDRPPTVSGRRASSLPDVVTTPSTDLFEHAFRNRPLDKKEGAK